jgi:hypothetical protein
MNHRIQALLLALATTLALAACGGSSNNSSADVGTVTTPADAAMAATDAAVAGADAGPTCFTNPTTHFQIINACTTSQGIAKNPVLPLLLPDGGLPPLP